MQGSQPGRQLAAQDDTRAAHRGSFSLLHFNMSLCELGWAVVWQVFLWGATWKEKFFDLWAAEFTLLVVSEYVFPKPTVCCILYESKFEDITATKCKFTREYEQLFNKNISAAKWEQLRAAILLGVLCTSFRLLVFEFYGHFFVYFALKPVYHRSVCMQVSRAGGVCHFPGGRSVCGQEQLSLCPVAMTTHQV